MKINDEMENNEIINYPEHNITSNNLEILENKINDITKKYLKHINNYINKLKYGE